MVPLMTNFTLVILFSSLVLSIFSLNSITSNVFAQTTNGTVSMNSGGGMQGMGGMSGGSGGGMQGMEGMSGGMQGMGGMEGMSGGMQGMGGMEGMSGEIKEMCDKMDGMPPHYCESSYNIMSSFMGVKIDKITPVSNKELQVQLKHLGNGSGTVDKNIVIVGGGENLAGSSMVPLGWRNSTTVPLVFEGVGSIYSTPSISLHVFPLTQ